MDENLLMAQLNWNIIIKFMYMKSSILESTRVFLLQVQVISSLSVDFLFLKANLSDHGLQVHVQLVFVQTSGAPWMVSSLVDSHHPSVCMSVELNL